MKPEEYEQKHRQWMLHNGLYRACWFKSEHLGLTEPERLRFTLNAFIEQNTAYEERILETARLGLAPIMLCPSCPNAEQVMKTFKEGKQAKRQSKVERQLKITMDALRRIDLGYRQSSGLTLAEQAYGMCSESKVAMEDIIRIGCDEEPIVRDGELWPGQLQARRYTE